MSVSTRKRGRPIKETDTLGGILHAFSCVLRLSGESMKRRTVRVNKQIFPVSINPEVIVSLHKQGLNQEQIARRLSCSHQHVSNVLAKWRKCGSTNEDDWYNSASR